MRGRVSAARMPLAATAAYRQQLGARRRHEKCCCRDAALEPHCCCCCRARTRLGGGLLPIPTAGQALAAAGNQAPPHVARRRGYRGAASQLMQRGARATNRIRKAVIDFVSFASPASLTVAGVYSPPPPPPTRPPAARVAAARCSTPERRCRRRTQQDGNSRDLQFLRQALRRTANSMWIPAGSESQRAMHTIPIWTKCLVSINY